MHSTDVTLTDELVHLLLHCTILHFILTYFEEVNRNCTFLGMENIYREVKLLFLRSTLQGSPKKNYAIKKKKSKLNCIKQRNFSVFTQCNGIPYDSKNRERKRYIEFKLFLTWSNSEHISRIEGFPWEQWSDCNFPIISSGPESFL